MLSLTHNSYIHALQGACKPDLVCMYLICMHAHPSYHAHIYKCIHQCSSQKFSALSIFHAHACMYICKIKNTSCIMLSTYIDATHKLILSLICTVRAKQESCLFFQLQITEHKCHFDFMCMHIYTYVCMYTYIHIHSTHTYKFKVMYM